jgi:hypothetical protein
MRAPPISALLCLLAATACSGATPDAQPGNPTYLAGSPQAIAAAVVAQQAGIPAEEVVIRSVEAVEFGDSSLGCPQPGMGYLQVITPGYKVIAEAADRSFDVRVAGSRGLICDPRAQSESPGSQP